MKRKNHRILWLLLVAALISLPAPQLSGSCRQLFATSIGLVRHLWSADAQSRPIKNAQQQARRVLGDMLPQKIETQVSYVTCLDSPGCKYSADFDVIQIDHEAIRANERALAAIYVHELAHAVQANQDPIVLKIRDELRSLKPHALKTYTRYHKVKRGMQTTGFWGNYLFVTHADATVLEDINIIHQEMAMIHADLRNGTLATPNTDSPSADELLRSAGREVFADLVACAAAANGNAMSEPMLRMSAPTELAALRENINVIHLTSLPQWQKVEAIDPHDVLQFARRQIWQLYIAGQSDAEVRRVVAVLNKVTLEWPTLVRPKLHRLAPATMIDIRHLNTDFLSYFESRIKS